MGLVVVPQAMAYALLARLSPAFGLYTTFTGACLYWVFGTSKDIVIGVSIIALTFTILNMTHSPVDYRCWFTPSWRCHRKNRSRTPWRLQVRRYRPRPFLSCWRCIARPRRFTNGLADRVHSLYTHFSFRHIS